MKSIWIWNNIIFNEDSKWKFSWLNNNLEYNVRDTTSNSVIDDKNNTQNIH